MSTKGSSSKEGRGVAPKALYDQPPFPRQHQDGTGLESELRPAPQWRGERYKAAGKLQDRVALVTGGDSGIGRAVAYFFAREGADVAITCLHEEWSDAQETADAIEELGRGCLIIQGDFNDAEFCDEVIEATLSRFGKLDILVHNAAWQNRKPITQLTEEELDTTLKVNVYTYLRLARAGVPNMKPGSCIIATGSIVGLSGAEDLSDYGATKGAIHSITRCLAKELLPKGIRVNCVAPGPVWTPLNPSDSGLAPKDVATFGSEYEMGRPAQPEELAPAYVYLASLADSSYVNGAVMPVTGAPI